jgi:hypothetical protein
MFSSNHEQCIGIIEEEDNVNIESPLEHEKTGIELGFIESID